TFLDRNGDNPGYTVFGRVVAGEDVVRAIEKVPTGTRKFHDDVPLEPIVIRAARRQ
ncbi:MAG: peptidyl-prolyl cis-trans isomerase, partial [Verrucomicrobiae bacterium]|nr:peptidyl-prolyl cis-trans isomerase [Verrucomicrobiae bacterium]